MTENRQYFLKDADLVMCLSFWWPRIVVHITSLTVSGSISKYLVDVPIETSKQETVQLCTYGQDLLGLGYTFYGRTILFSMVLITNRKSIHLPKQSIWEIPVCKTCFVATLKCFSLQELCVCFHIYFLLSTIETNLIHLINFEIHHIYFRSISLRQCFCILVILPSCFLHSLVLFSLSRFLSFFTQVNQNKNQLIKHTASIWLTQRINDRIKKSQFSILTILVSFYLLFSDENITEYTIKKIAKSSDITYIYKFIYGIWSNQFTPTLTKHWNLYWWQRQWLFDNKYF